MRDDSTMTPALPRLLLNSREMARALSISERHLFGLTKSDGLPCIRLGKSVRFRPSDVERWLAERAEVRGELQCT